MTSCYLAVAVFGYAALTLSIIDDGTRHIGPHAAANGSEKLARSRQIGQSQHVKSNQFMLKDAFCNFNNGDLVCHRATGLRHIPNLTGS